MTGWKLFASGAVLLMAVVYPMNVGRWLRGKPIVRTCVKCAGSLIAAAIAVCGALHTPDCAARLVALGLLVCVIADAAIVSSLFAGMAVFLIGHLCYLGAFLHLASFSAYSLIPFAVFCIGIIAAQSGKVQKTKKGAVYFVIYGAVLLFTLSTSLLLPSRTGLRGVAAAAGMLLFVISDYLIAAKIFPQNRIRRDAVIMGLYYAALLLLSLVALQPWL